MNEMFTMRLPPFRPMNRLLLCVLLSGAPLFAGAAPTIEFDFDDPPETGRSLSESTQWGMDLHVNVESRDDLDLDARARDRLLFVEPEFRAALAYTPPGRPWQAFVEMEIAGRTVLIDQADGQRDNYDLRLRQGYLLVPDLGHGFSLQAGRQSFKDARTWWYDEKMDALRVYWRKERYGLELAAARERLLPEDLFDADTRKKNDYLILAGHYALERKSTLNLLAVRRDDRESSKNEDPLLLGAQINGEVGKDFRYWLNAARVGGKAKGEKLRAFGWDVGATWRFDLPYRPYVALGLARGSGDSQGGDKLDKDFRQTDLQENKARLFGLTRYNYYGEAFDPELSNMRIFTAAAGFYPTTNLSLDLVYHRYQQIHADDDLFDSDLDIDPDGDHRGLGEGIDLIAGLRINPDTRLKLVLGSFRPGRAYPRPDPAYVVKLEIGWRF